jgi:hypothetical protein
VIMKSMSVGLLALCLASVGIARGQSPDASQSLLSVAAYPSIQEAIDKNPGRWIYLPAGEYQLTQAIRISTDNSGLWGPGRIILTNPDQPIVRIEHASGVQLHDLTLTRAAGAMETAAEGVVAIECHDFVLENVRVLDNRTRSGAIALRDCANSRLVGCLVRNYMRVTVEDRTANLQLGGYAFRCIDGTGISVTRCQGTLIQGNRIVEENLIPTQELKQKHGLGDFVKKNAEKPERISQKMWDEGYTDNWHQGSAITVTAPEVSDRTQILGNTIENAAQGIDLHADHVIVAQNIVNKAFIGMKAMHGSRNVLIIGNQFIKNDLWSIGLMPGAASHAALAAEGKNEAREANTDGGSMIANNIISDFGYGNAHWIWGNQRSPLKFDTGQLPGNPPLTDVLIQGNIVFDAGRQKVIIDGKPVFEPPRYRYAVVVPSGENAPQGLRFANNIFHPGTDGISNVELPE